MGESEVHGHPPAPGRADEPDAFVTEVVQEPAQVIGLTERPGRGRGLAEASQVVPDDGISLREGGHDRVPHGVVGDAGVHEHQGRTFAGDGVRKMAEIVGKDKHPQIVAGEHRTGHRIPEVTARASVRRPADTDTDMDTGSRGLTRAHRAGGRMRAVPAAVRRGVGAVLRTGSGRSATHAPRCNARPSSAG